MSTRQLLAVLGFVTIAAIPALADLPCPPATSPPMTVAMFLDDLLDSLIQNGISILFLGALAAVGVPWMMAGLAMALVQLARKF